MLQLSAWVVTVLGWGTPGVTLGALVATLLRRWPLAYRLARLACAMALAACVVAVLGLWGVPSVLSSSSKWIVTFGEENESPLARLAAEAISEILNCAAQAVLAAIPAGGLWVLARRQLRQAGNG